LDNPGVWVLSSGYMSDSRFSIVILRSIVRRD
jgi:hypothetical protein